MSRNKMAKVHYIITQILNVSLSLSFFQTSLEVSSIIISVTSETFKDIILFAHHTEHNILLPVLFKYLISF